MEVRRSGGQEVRRSARRLEVSAAVGGGWRSANNERVLRVPGSAAVGGQQTTSQYGERHAVKLGGLRCRGRVGMLSRRGVLSQIAAWL